MKNSKWQGRALTDDCKKIKHKEGIPVTQSKASYDEEQNSNNHETKQTPNGGSARLEIIEQGSVHNMHMSGLRSCLEQGPNKDEGSCRCSLRTRVTEQ